ncbi:MAG: hypothetical protein V5A15_03475, partial [Haloarcula sp.]
MSKWNPLDSEDDRSDGRHTDGGVTQGRDRDEPENETPPPADRRDGPEPNRTADDPERAKLKAQCEQLAAELEQERA